MNRGLVIAFALVVSMCLPGAYGSIQASDGPSVSQGFELPPSSNQLLEIEQGLGDESHVRDALQQCENILKDDPDNLKYLLKTAYLYYRLGWLFAGTEERKAYYFKLYDYASRASTLAPHDYGSSLLLAVAKAKIVGYLSHKDQVRMARELAEDTEALVKFKGDDPDPVYLLSWLNFEIGRISPMNKVLAAVLFGGLPQGLSVENAFALMGKAIQLRPNYVVYQYDLGFYYLKTGVKDKARRQFEQVLAMQPQSAEAVVYQRRATAKIRELNAVN